MAGIEEHGTNAVASSEAYIDQPTDTGHVPDFSICSVLFCTPHGNMSKQPAKFFNLTSALPNVNSLPPTDLVAAAEKLCTELPTDDETIELYRSTKTSMFNFSVTSHVSNPLAKFHIPANTWAAIGIHFDPSASFPDQAQQKTIVLSQKKAQKARLSRSYSFVHNSCTYTWKFISGMEINLRSPRDGHDKVLAKFFFKPSWFSSCGVLAMGVGEEGAGQEGGRQGEEAQRARVQESRELWERVVVVTLLAVLRREREWRYILAGHFFPMKRTIC